MTDEDAQDAQGHAKEIPARGIECPECGCRQFRTIYTRQRTRHIQRRRECRHCQKRITTSERIAGR